MRLKAKRSGSGGGSRLGLAILAATVAAFLLAPVAAQAATGVETQKVNIEGNGGGEVLSGPGTPLEENGYWGASPYIGCKGPPATAIGPGTCETLMSDEGEGFESVFLSAQPNPGSAVKWTVQKGETLYCQELACLTYVEEGAGTDSEVTAIFNKAFTVKMVGEGSVISNPEGINCLAPSTSCSAELEGLVTLTASPAAGYALSSWKGCDTGGAVGLKCTVTASVAKTVTATFVKTPTLTVKKAGSGSGKVSATGISCDDSCTEASSAIKTGTAVTVKATPSKGSKAAIFESGTGSAAVPACSGAGPCTFTIAANSSVKVKFEPIPTKTLTVGLLGDGAYKGKVTGKVLTGKGLLPAGINCGAGCTKATETLLEGAEVELVPSAAPGYEFVQWQPGAGSCALTKVSPCMVTMTANKTIEAKFK